MNKAVFFDRDGVINNNSKYYYVYNTDMFEINEGVIESLNYFSNKGFLLIIISNQSGIGKGIYTKNDIDYLHEQFSNTLKNCNILIHEFYYCPHHPDFSNCLCRKPKSVLLEKSVARFDIDITKSLLIGDSDRDIESANNIGLKSVKVSANGNLYQELKNKGIII